MQTSDEFLSVLAHEMRMPLAPIGSALEVLRLGADDPFVAEYVRAVIGRQLHQLERLVEDLLDVSRLAHGRVQLRLESVDLAPVVNAAIETVQPLIEARRHRLTTVLPSTALTVQGDTDRLTQVFVNLLNNAAKYTQPGGHIWVMAERESGWAIVRVRDTGIGIEPEMLTQIFEMFVQAEPAQKREGASGLGIGLALARQLTELHGGAISASSEGRGRGSEFIVRMPCPQ